MKKLIYSLLALATALTAASCAKELEGNKVAEGGTATITLSVSLGPQTKTIADGTTVDKLYAGIYEIGGTQQAPEFTWVADNSDNLATITNKAATVEFTGKIELGKSYKVVLWAQNTDAPYSIDWAKSATTGPTVTVTNYTTGAANDETRDAFFGTYDTGAVTGNIDLTGEPIILKRPFAQVNVLVPVGNFDDVNADISSSMTIVDAPTVLNLATKVTSGLHNWAFTDATMTGAAFGNYSGTHKYVAMNYVLVDQGGAATYDVTFSATSSASTPQTASDKAADDLPMKPNSRTNIVGDIFTSNIFDISIGIDISPDPDKVETPTFSPAAGEYDSAQNVTITCTTDGATI